MIYGLLGWRLWSGLVVLRFSKALPFIFFVPLYPLTTKCQITGECWLARKQSFHTLPKTFDHLSFPNNYDRGKKQTKWALKQPYCCIADWVSSVNHKCRALETRSANRDVTLNAIHSQSSQAFSQQTWSTAGSEGKAPELLGDQMHPSWVRQYPTAPLWSWANANDLGDCVNAYNQLTLCDKTNKIYRIKKV